MTGVCGITGASLEDTVMQHDAETTDVCGIMGSFAEVAIELGVAE